MTNVIKTLFLTDNIKKQNMFIFASLKSES